MATFNFNNLEKKKEVAVITVKEGEEDNGRRISRGLNMEGNCQNQKCRLYENRVLSQQEMGEFSINELTVTSACPVCNEELENVDNMYFY